MAVQLVDFFSEGLGKVFYAAGHFVWSCPGQGGKQLRKWTLTCIQIQFSTLYSSLPNQQVNKIFSLLSIETVSDFLL